MNFLYYWLIQAYDKEVKKNGAMVQMMGVTSVRIYAETGIQALSRARELLPGRKFYRIGDVSEQIDIHGFQEDLLKTMKEAHTGPKKPWEKE